MILMDERFKELDKRYGKRNLMEELNYTANYYSGGNPEYIRWLAYKAFKRIKESELNG